MKPFGNSRLVVCELVLVSRVPIVDVLMFESLFLAGILLDSDAVDPKVPVAVDASAAEPATFANVRLDIFLLMKCSPRP
jgi:hypothetical protein